MTIPGHVVPDALERTAACLQVGVQDLASPRSEIHVGVTDDGGANTIAALLSADPLGLAHGFEVIRTKRAVVRRAVDEHGLDNVVSLTDVTLEVGSVVSVSRPHVVVCFDDWDLRAYRGFCIRGRGLMLVHRTLSIDEAAWLARPTRRRTSARAPR